MLELQDLPRFHDLRDQPIQTSYRCGHLQLFLQPGISHPRNCAPRSLAFQTVEDHSSIRSNHSSERRNALVYQSLSSLGRPPQHLPMS